MGNHHSNEPIMPLTDTTAPVTNADTTIRWRVSDPFGVDT